MKIIRTANEMNMWSKPIRQAGHTIGFVPTMGALHEAHLALIQQAHKEYYRTVVSIFVNPTQFDDASDLENYPRSVERDLKLCEEAGVEVVFLPTEEELYPEGATVDIRAPDLAKRLCGESRPEHFDGVLTVVRKLLQIVEPSHALFGEKDFQQLAIIRWLVKAQELAVKIVAHPIVRSLDGLALSSRNRRLSSDEHKQALVLHQAILAVQACFAGGERESAALLERARGVLATEPHVFVDYYELVDTETLEPVDQITKPTLFALAANVGPVRLIDNCVLSV